MNSTKGAKNIFWGLMAQIITIGVGVLIPRLVLVNLGSESNGLMNSVSSVLTYLSLLEAGAGTATIQALYEPIARTDRDSINRIMSATHFFYRRTGFVYLVLVTVLTVGYTIFAVTELPKIYVFLVVFISGLPGVLSYFFQGKYRLLLSAEGKGYIVTNISTVTSVGVSLTKAIVLIAGILMIPFLRLYTRGVTDINYLESKVALLFLVYYLMDNGRKPSSVVINIAQHFEKTKWRAILEAVINLTASILLTVRFGIYGVLAGTIIALLYRANDMIIYTSKLLERSPMVTYRRWGLNILVSASLVVCAKLVAISPDNYFKLVVYGIILSMITLPLFLGINSITNIEAAKYTWSVVKGVIMQRFKTNKQ